MDDQLKKLEKSLNLEFTNKDLLKKALCHRSYLNENNFHLNHNERLEFLGDAVLELIVTEYLFNHYPEKPEGDLTDWRAALVNTKMLAEVAEELDLFQYLLLSKGERDKQGRSKQYILADAFEALIGAIYLDQGRAATKKFIEDCLLTKLSKIISLELFKDPKSELQEIAQEAVSITPEYKVLNESGPDHNKEFEIGVFLEEEKIAKGKGSSKQEAEEQAAQKALKKKFNQ